VAGVVPALEAHHDVGAAGKPVDDLALAFIAPLGADHGDVGQGEVLSLVRGETGAALGGGGRKGKGMRDRSRDGWPVCERTSSDIQLSDNLRHD
jgi:hypothetical protein